MDCPRCKNANIDWCVRAPTDPSPYNPKVEMLSQLCKEEGATLEPTFPVKDSHLYVMMGT